jgi:hypothetical protein
MIMTGGLEGLLLMHVNVRTGAILPLCPTRVKPALGEGGGGFAECQDDGRREGLADGGESGTMQAMLKEVLAMIELTEEQLRALAGGTEPVRAIDSVTKTEYVLVRADVFDRLTAISYDDSSWTDEERDLLRAEAVDTLGWEGMEAYQDDEP